MSYLLDKLKNNYLSKFKRKSNIPDEEFEPLLNVGLEEQKQAEIIELYKTIGNQNILDNYAKKKEPELTCRDVYIFC